MTDRATNVSGTVTDTLHQPVLDYTVVFLPSEDKIGVSQARFVHTARPKPYRRDNTSRPLWNH